MIYDICLSLSDLFHSLGRSLDPSMLLQMASFRSFLRRSSIPLYICTTVSFCIHLPMDTGCFHVLVTVNSVVMNTGMHVSFQIMSTSEYMPRSGINAETLGFSPDGACVCVCVCVCCVQSCLTLCDPLDCSPPSSSVHGNPQTRVLEQVAISSFRGSSRPRDRTRVSLVSCISKQILYHCITREAPKLQ